MISNIYQRGESRAVESSCYCLGLGQCTGASCCTLQCTVHWSSAVSISSMKQGSPEHTTMLYPGILHLGDFSTHRWLSFDFFRICQASCGVENKWPFPPKESALFVFQLCSSIGDVHEGVHSSILFGYHQFVCNITFNHSILIDWLIDGWIIHWISIWTVCYFEWA